MFEGKKTKEKKKERRRRERKKEQETLRERWKDDDRNDEDEYFSRSINQSDRSSSFLACSSSIRQTPLHSCLLWVCIRFWEGLFEEEERKCFCSGAGGGGEFSSVFVVMVKLHTLLSFSHSPNSFYQHSHDSQTTPQETRELAS